MAVKKPTKKTTTRKATAKKPTTKKATAKKPAPKKPPTAKALPKAKGKGNLTDAIKLLKGTGNTRRPPNNPDIPQQIIGFINADLNQVKSALEEYAQHFRPLDRKRKNRVGIERQGFIERALELAEENPEFLPHYVPIEDFQGDYQYFVDVRALYDLSKQISELLMNIMVEAADMVYTDALDYYTAVKEAAKRRVDPAETLYKELEPIFKKQGTRKTNPDGTPTKKQLKRDFNALDRGTRSGEIIIENIKPKLTGGTRKVIDEELRDDIKYKETDQGEIKE